MTKIISISDEAYENLKKIKDEKSFSQIIIEITQEKSQDKLRKFVGSITKSEAEKITKNIYKERKIKSRRFQ